MKKEKRDKRDLQFNYAADHPLLYNKQSRKKKADRIVKLLSSFLKKGEMKRLSILDIGGSAGIIDFFLARYFKKVVCVDIDRAALDFARRKFRLSNLQFRLVDIMDSDIPSNSFDVIICTHVYEHVPNQDKLFSEIYRILKPNGFCYLAATNRSWIIEPHYHLPFLSWLPKSLADRSLRFLKRSNRYYETPRTYWELKHMLNRFEILEFTSKIFKDSKKYGYDDTLIGKFPIRYISWLLSPLAQYLSPTFIWLLIKTKER